MKGIYSRRSLMLRLVASLIMFSVAALLPIKPCLARRSRLRPREGQSKPAALTKGKQAAEPAEAAHAAKPAPVSATMVQLPESPQPGTMVCAAAGIELVWIPPGEYLIGSSEQDLAQVIREYGDKGYNGIPTYPHEGGIQDELYFGGATRLAVRLRAGFWIAKYETTQGQWKAVMGNNPSLFQGAKNRLGNDDAMPVEQVSWNDAQEFIKKLNQRNDGLTYRLPTDAEWEYAARAGTTGDYAGPLDEMGWYASNSGRNYADSIEEWKKFEDWAALSPVDTKRTWRQFLEPKGHQPHPVGAKTPNAWGVHDMHGNVWEWCEDKNSSYHGDEQKDGSAYLIGAEPNTWRLLRGGAFHNFAWSVRPARRIWELSQNRFDTVGFRVVAVASGKGSKTLHQTEALKPPAAEGAKPMQTTGAHAPQAGTMMRAPAGFEMVWIPEGEFTIGTSKADRIRLLHLSEKKVPISDDDVNDESAGPKITFKSGFWMSRYETTQGQWKAAMGNNPSLRQGAKNRLGNDDSMPVEQVSYEDVQEFLRKLNERNDEWTYRLPSESEWEYACRAGTTEDYAGRLDEMGWYANNSGDKYLEVYEIYAMKTERYFDARQLWEKHLGPNGNQPHPVGSKKPNAWGLYDMHGNVLEWVAGTESTKGYEEAFPKDGSSNLTDSQRAGRVRFYAVIRGGAFHNPAWRCRSAKRDNGLTMDRLNTVGFRIVMVPRK